ncbi:metal-dependent hydrolase [Corallincola spongiicola]|uniref:Metal-dependent hydrolase n=1 Tax=Corallincola spongiicola TaxID=2520508 RepID=A0ABY1WP61_9GAMM|nr:metal-dependent hydrolase [Corallincola spongiicola]TAA45866.1 metal-dependent hydrolase [Corallincola spongiicola]
MDSVTQAALGAAVGGAIGGRQLGWRAFVWGAGLGTLPDMDVFIHYPDAVDQVTKHRGFSHSIFVLTALSPVLGLLIAKLHRWRFWGATLMAWLCLVTHPLLDCFTSYGTQLFWPLASPPIAWSTIFIIDPLYTLPLLIGIGVSLWLLRRRQDSSALRPTYGGLLVSQLYLALSVVLMLGAKSEATAELRRQGIEANTFLSPTPFNILSWRIVANHHDNTMIGYYSWLNPKTPVFVSYPNGHQLADAAQLDNLKRLDWFTQGFYQLQEANGQLKFVDLRLGVEPYLPFRYILAEHTTAGWQAIPAVLLPANPAGLELLPELLQLIKGQAVAHSTQYAIDIPATPAASNAP